MEILRVAVPSGKQCNQITTDNGEKYYFNDEGKINDNLFVVSPNPLVVVDEAAKNDLGVIDGAGNIVIPLDKKEIKKVDRVDNYLLVVESNPTDPKVLDAISKQNDPGFRPQIANEMGEIEAQMMAEMNRDGADSKMLFADSYSQASLYDLSGNKIPGTDSSFIGQNNGAIYFHDNVKGSSSQKMKTGEVENTNVDVPVEAPVEQEVVEENVEVQPEVGMNADGSFGAQVENNDGKEEFTNTEAFNFEESNTVNNENAMPSDFYEKMESINNEVPSYDIPVEEEVEENNIDSYVEPEEPDALINDAIEKFEESYSVVENLKKVIDKRDEKYDKMVADYERKLAESDERHAKEVEELNYKYDTDIAKLKNHGANWQSRYQRANARAEVLDEEGKKKADTIEKLREQLRESFEEVSQLKNDQAELNAKYENIQEELKAEQKMHTEEAERASNLQEENNRLIKGRSKLIENMKNMTRQISSVQELVKGVAPEVEFDNKEIASDYDDKQIEDTNDAFKEVDENIVDFSLGDSLTSIPVAFTEDENYTYEKTA